MDDLLLDPQIRSWVVVPIVLITFFIGIGRHFVSILINEPKPSDIDKIRENQTLQRGRYLRANGNYIPKEAFNSRKNDLNDKETGKYEVIIKKHKDSGPPNPMTDPSMMQDMLKGQFVNMIPMIVVGQIINTVFSGFVTIRVPFPLSLAFKPMLQQGVELSTLSASWVSSMSFYFICVFGLRSIYPLILGQASSADELKVMQQQMSGAGAGGPQDPAKTFKAEWEAMEVVHHVWTLDPKSTPKGKHQLASVERDVLNSWTG